MNILKDSLDPNLIDVLHTLEQLGADYYLINGTLLGLHRDRELIPWDGDIDICIVRDSIDILNLVEALRSKGFKGGVDKRRRPGLPLFKFKKDGGRIVEINFQDKFIASNGEVCIRQRWFKTDDPEERSVLSKTQLVALRICNKLYKKQCFDGLLQTRRLKAYSPCLIVNRVFSFVINWLEHRFLLDATFGYVYPAKYSDSKIEIAYGGAIAVIPAKSDEICSVIYGPGWKTPIKSDHWTQFLQD